MIETNLDGARPQVRAGDSLPGDVRHRKVSPDGCLTVENERVILPAYLLHPVQVLADERQVGPVHRVNPAGIEACRFVWKDEHLVDDHTIAEAPSCIFHILPVDCWPALEHTVKRLLEGDDLLVEPSVEVFINRDMMVVPVDDVIVRERIAVRVQDKTSLLVVLPAERIGQHTARYCHPPLARQFIAFGSLADDERHIAVKVLTPTVEHLPVELASRRETTLLNDAATAYPYPVAQLDHWTLLHNYRHVASLAYQNEIMHAAVRNHDRLQVPPGRHIGKLLSGLPVGKEEVNALSCGTDEDHVRYLGRDETLEPFLTHLHGNA